MKANNRNYLLIAAAISLTSLPLGSSLTRAALSPIPTLMPDSHVKPSTWTIQPNTPQLMAQTTRSYSHQLLTLINAQRQKVGAPPLKLNLKLTQAALGHSQDMAINNFDPNNSHTGSDGSDPKTRIIATGYNCCRYFAENIAAGAERSTPRAVVQAWLESPAHKENMLNPNYTEVGFGYAYNSQSIYINHWTADFAQPF